MTWAEHASLHNVVSQASAAGGLRIDSSTKILNLRLATFPLSFQHLVMQRIAHAVSGRSESPLLSRIRNILQSAQASAARTVNSAQVISNWLVGREIVEDEQRGNRRAAYQQRVLERLAAKMQREFGGGYSLTNLKIIRKFYVAYPRFLVSTGKGQPLADQLNESTRAAEHSRDWCAGQFSPNISWRHYTALLKIDIPDARNFYELETLSNHWSARELERQIASLLYERLAKSRDKAGLMRLATKGAAPAKPVEIFKDPTVIEFLGLPESPVLTESGLESALLSNLQSFLLELGRGFAFVARQQRISLDGDHFYIDLVFYHSVLKCFVLVDLKVGKLTHADLGQLQLYVNYYDLERRAPDDNPTLGLILCSDKNDAVVKYTLGPNQEDKIFASRYKLHLPSEADLRAQLQARRRLSTE